MTGGTCSVRLTLSLEGLAPFHRPWTPSSLATPTHPLRPPLAESAGGCSPAFCARSGRTPRVRPAEPIVGRDPSMRRSWRSRAKGGCRGRPGGSAPRALRPERARMSLPVNGRPTRRIATMMPSSDCRVHPPLGLPSSGLWPTSDRWLRRPLRVWFSWRSESTGTAVPRARASRNGAQTIDRLRSRFSGRLANLREESRSSLGPRVARSRSRPAIRSRSRT